MVVFALIIGIAVGASVTYVYDKAKCYEADRTLLFDVKLTELALETNTLHLLLIKHYSSVEHEIESEIPGKVKTLRQLYTHRHFNNADATELERLLRPNWETQKTEMLGSFGLLYGLNEKFPIRRWRHDPDMMQALGQAAKSRPRFVKWLRCQDWSKPMWVGKDECKKAKPERKK